MNKLLKTWLLLDFAFINILVAFMLYRSILLPTYKKNTITPETNTISQPKLQTSSSSIPISSFLSTPTMTPIPTTTVSPLIIEKSDSPQPTSTASPVKSISYIPMTGSGQSSENDWVDVSGSSFYLNTSDYPNNLQAYLEVYLRLINGNGKAYVRLYDVTNNREVDNSVIETSNQSLTSLSTGAITLWQGNNLYKIQIKTLTADIVEYKPGRIKLIYQN